MGAIRSRDGVRDVETQPGTPQQLPLIQNAWMKSHCRPQEPQFSGSVLVLTQIPPQLWNPSTQH